MQNNNGRNRTKQSLFVKLPHRIFHFLFVLFTLKNPPDGGLKIWWVLRDSLGTWGACGAFVPAHFVGCARRLGRLADSKSNQGFRPQPPIPKNKTD